MVENYNIKVIYVCIHLDVWDSLVIYGGVDKSNDIPQNPDSCKLNLNIYEQVLDVGQHISLHTNQKTIISIAIIYNSPTVNPVCISLYS